MKKQILFYEMTSLQLWHVFDMACAGYKTFADALFCWTPFRIYLSHIKQPPWPEFVSHLATIYEEFKDSKDIGSFVKKAMVYAFPVLVKAKKHAPPDNHRWFDCFKYSYDSKTGLASLHFRNAVTPKSPFADMPALFSSLHRMLDDITKKGLKIERMGCGSWINNITSFQKLFPQSYIHSLTPTSPDEKIGNGWWGQFIDHTGQLHQRRAEILKRKRRFEFARLYGECDFVDFKNHILLKTKDKSISKKKI